MYSQEEEEEEEGEEYNNQNYYNYKAVYESLFKIFKKNITNLNNFILLNDINNQKILLNYTNFIFTTPSCGGLGNQVSL